MFGGQWGAFDSRKRHFFRPAHPIYKAIARIAAVRQGQAALRYGRQYFREISGNGKDFGFPIVDGRCTLAFSRILDTREILVALNLDSPPRQDFITLDANLSAADGILSNLLSPESNFTVEKRGERHAVQVPLAAYGMAILGKRKIAAC